MFLKGELIRKTDVGFSKVKKGKIMVKIQKRRYEKPKIHYFTDFDIVLECVYELYEEEKQVILKESNIQKTMIFIFLKMLEKECKEISAEQIHEKIWNSNSLVNGKEKFIEVAGKLLKPYRVV